MGAGVEVASLEAALSLSAGAFERGMVAAEARAHSGGAVIAAALGGIGIGAAAALVGSLKEATDYQSMLSKIQANTTLTNSQMGVLSTSIQDMAVKTGAPLDQLATGFMKATNLGFSAADAMKILTVANMSALSTGSKTADVTNVLALQLHEFGMQASQAAQAMDVLHLAGALGNATLEEFVNNSSKSTAMAANFHVPLIQIDGALSALSRHMDLAQANTALAGFLVNIEKPSIAASKELRLLSKSGVDLTGDFTPAGLAAKGLTGIIDDLRKATGGNVAEMLRLVPAMRGGLATIVLTGTGTKDYLDIVNQLADAMAGKLTPTQDAFARQQATIASSMDKLRQSVTVMAIAVGSALLPPLEHLMETVLPIVETITEWVRAHGQLTAQILGGVAAVGLLAGGMTVLEMALGPLAGVIAALGAPLLLIGGALAGLAVAWQHDWGGIRETAIGAWVALQPLLHGISDAVGETAAAFRRGGLGAAAETGLSEVQRLLTGLGGWITTTAFPDLATRMGNLAGAFWGWVQTIPSLLPQLATWLGHIKDWITGPAWKTVHDHVATWGAAFVGWIGPRIAPLLGQLGGLLGTVGGWIAGALHTVVSHLELWGQALVNWVGPRIGPLLGQLGALLGAMGTWLRGALGTVASQVQLWGQALVNWVAPRIGPLLAQLGQLKDRVSAWLGGELPVIRAAVVGWAAELATLGTKAWSGLQPTLRTLGKGIITWMDDRTNEIRTNTTKWANAFADWVDPAKSKIPGKLDGFTAAVTAWVNSKGMQAMLNLASALGDAFLAALGEVLKRKAAAAFSGFLPQNWLKNWTDILGGNTVIDIAKFGLNQGASLGDAIHKGISGAISRGTPGTQAAIKKHLDDTHTHARAAIKASSPSRVYWDLGHDMMAGLALGITDNAKLVQDALARVLAPAALAGGLGGRGGLLAGGAGAAGRTAGQNLFGGAGAFALPPLSAAGGAGVGSGSLTINVYTTPQGGVSVAGGSGDEHEFARQLGEFAQQMLTSQRRAGRGAARTLPGAR